MRAVVCYNMEPAKDIARQLVVDRQIVDADIKERPKRDRDTVDESGGAGGSRRPQKQQTGGADTGAPDGLTGNSPDEPNGLNEVDPNTGESGEDIVWEPFRDIIAVLCKYVGQSPADLGNLARVNKWWRQVVRLNIRVVRVRSRDAVERALRDYQRADALQVLNVHSLAGQSSIEAVEIGDGWHIEEVRGFILDCVEAFPGLKVLNLGLCQEHPCVCNMTPVLDAIMQIKTLKAFFAEAYVLQESDITRLAHGIPALKAIVAKRVDAASVSSGMWWCDGGESGGTTPWSLGALEYCAPFKPNLRSVVLEFPLTDNVVEALSPYRLKMLSVHGISASWKALRSLHSHNLDSISILSSDCTLSQLAALGHVRSITVDGNVTDDDPVMAVHSVPARTTTVEILGDITDLCANVLQTFPLLERLECCSISAEPASLRRFGSLVDFTSDDEVTTDQLIAISSGTKLTRLKIRRVAEPISAKLCRALSKLKFLSVGTRLEGAEMRHLGKHLTVQVLQCKFEQTLVLDDFREFIDNRSKCVLKISSAVDYAVTKFSSALVELEEKARLIDVERLTRDLLRASRTERGRDRCLCGGVQ